MTNELQNFYLYLKQNESSVKTTKNYFKQDSKNYIWNEKWEKHYKECASTLMDYCCRRKNIDEELSCIDIT